MALARTVLPVPGHVLDQQVAAAQQRDEREADLVVLADDDALDVGEDACPRSPGSSSSASLALGAATPMARYAGRCQGVRRTRLGVRGVGG